MWFGSQVAISGKMQSRMICRIMHSNRPDVHIHSLLNAKILAQQPVAEVHSYSSGAL